MNVNSQTETLQSTSLQAPQVLFLKRTRVCVCVCVHMLICGENIEMKMSSDLKNKYINFNMNPFYGKLLFIAVTIFVF